MDPLNKQNKTPLSPFKLYPPRYTQPLRYPLLVGLRGHQTITQDVFQRFIQAKQNELKAKENQSKAEKKEETSKQTEQRPKSLLDLLKHDSAYKSLWHKQRKALTAGEAKSHDKHSETPGSQTPSEVDEVEFKELLEKLSTTELLSIMSNRSTPTTSEASHDSFVRVGSKANSSNGDHYDVRSLPETLPGSPWMTLPHSPLLLSRAASTMRLAFPSIDAEHEQKLLEYKPHEEDSDSSDSEDEKVEESTATLKP